MARYKFVTSGSEILFKDNDSLIATLDPTSRSVEWEFDSTGGITWWVSNVKYQTDNIANIEFDEVACDSQDDFETGIAAMFTGYAAGGSGVGYPDGTKMYVALLNQSGTDAPVATVLVNTLGGTVVWARTDAGIYTATLSNVFTTGKTAILITNAFQPDADAVFCRAVHTSQSVITVNSLDNTYVLAEMVNGSPITIQILVFP